MLIASYLLGYNDDGSVNYLGVDQAFPGEIGGACFELTKSPSQDGAVAGYCYDLWIYFPAAGETQLGLCLPELPELVVSAFVAGQSLPLLDFACGRSLVVADPVIRVSGIHQECA